jgi:uncharacterized membrane protein YgcG
MVHTRTLAGGLLVAVLVAGFAVGLQAPANAAANAPANANAAVVAASSVSQCQRLQGLTTADLCVSVQGTVSSIRPGGTAMYSVSVWVEGGFTTSVSVALATEPSGAQATFTSGCPVGIGTARCWIPALALLGAPASYQMQAEIPAVSSTPAVTLAATASVPTLLPWTPPSAAASVMVSAPPPPKPAPSPAPTKRSSPPPPGKSPHGSSPGSAGSGGTGGSGSTGSGSAGSGGVGLPAGSRAVLPLGPLPGPTFVVGAGNATGLFPTISPSPGQNAAARAGAAIQAVPAADGLRLAPTGLILGLVLAAVGIMFWTMDFHRRKRAGTKG